MALCSNLLQVSHVARQIEAAGEMVKEGGGGGYVEVVM